MDAREIKQRDGYTMSLELHCKLFILVLPMQKKSLTTEKTEIKLAVTEKQYTFFPPLIGIISMNGGIFFYLESSKRELKRFFNN